MVLTSRPVSVIHGDPFVRPLLETHEASTIEESMTTKAKPIPLTPVIRIFMLFK